IYSATRPSQNTGLDTPSNENPRTTWSSHWLRRTAEITPNGTPSTIPTTVAMMANSALAGRYRPRSSATGIWVRIETPILPCPRFFRYVKYCSGRGLSSPHCCLNAATIVGSSIDRCPKCAATGSAGTECETTNAISVMPSIKGTISRTLRRIRACIYSVFGSGALRPPPPVGAALVPRSALLPAASTRDGLSALGMSVPSIRLTPKRPDVTPSTTASECESCESFGGEIGPHLAKPHHAGGGGGKECAARHERSNDWPQGGAQRSP